MRAAFRLTLIHGPVGPLQKRLHRIVGPQPGCTGGNADSDFPPLKCDPFAVNLLGELLRLERGRAIVGMVQNDGEFIAADASDQVGTAHIGKQDLRKMLQSGISAGMAVTVVHIP